MLLFIVGVWCVLGFIFWMNLLTNLMHEDESFFIRHKWKFLALGLVSGPVVWLFVFFCSFMELSHYIGRKIKESDKK